MKSGAEPPPIDAPPRKPSIELEVNRHHTSHRELLQPVDPAQHAVQPVDAIIVPSARPAPYADHAIGLARQLGCQLLVLCSKKSSAAKVAERAGRGVRLWAIDVSGQESLLPSFRTGHASVNDIFRRASDLSFKRNLALLIARLAGWERIVFLDDDIKVPDPLDLCRAGSLTAVYDSVGLGNHGYPDNSVVCHAHRLTGGRQETFVGGGAMAVAAQRTMSFFPDVYNEDWFFLLDDARMRPTTMYGTVVQAPYDPFDHAGRAMAEEFGDCLAEGIYALLDVGRRVRDADERFWVGFLEGRRQLIADNLRNLQRRPLPPDLRRRMVASLVAAERRRRLIAPARCVEFLRAWRWDLRTWRQHLTSFDGVLSVPAALRRIGIPNNRVARLRRAPSVPTPPRVSEPVPIPAAAFAPA